MPVFEYQCKDCNNKYDVYHKSSTNLSEIVCPSCGSEEHKKLFSAFSASVSSLAAPSCESGSCGIPAPTGGCASGMCGLN